MGNIMLILAPVGVAFLVGLTWYFAGSKVASFANADEALARLRLDFYDFEPEEIAVAAQTGQVALALPANPQTPGEIAIAFAVGEDFATRLLHKGDVKKLSRAGAALSFRVNEFTGKTVKVAFDSEDEAGRWEERLAQLA